MTAPPEASFTDVPETVQSIYTETSGLGYAILLSTTQGYTHDPIEISMAVDTEGKIVGTQVLSYPDTKDMGVDTYPQTYIGQDSTRGRESRRGRDVLPRRSMTPFSTASPLSRRMNSSARASRATHSFSPS